MRSKMWERGRKDRATSAGPNSMNTCLAPSTFDTMLRCVSITPLGSPVVPEV
jgi:hypothetical protein